MGTWSPIILGNDTTCEVRERFHEIYDSGVDAIDVIPIIFEESKEIQKLDRTNFWFGVSLAAWECQVLTEEMLETVREIITSGEDLQKCRELEADEKFIKNRELKLQKFLEKISVAKSKPRARKRIPEPIETEYCAGQCYAYKNNNGHYICFIVTVSEHYKFNGDIFFAFLNYESPQKPSLNDCLKSFLYGVEKLDNKWGQYKYKGNETGLSYEKKNQKDFFTCFDTLFELIGKLNKLDLNKITFNVKIGFGNYKDPNSIIDLIEKIRVQTASNCKVSSISLEHLLNI